MYEFAGTFFSPPQTISQNTLFLQREYEDTNFEGGLPNCGHRMRSSDHELLLLRQIDE